MATSELGAGGGPPKAGDPIRYVGNDPRYLNQRGRCLESHPHYADPKRPGTVLVRWEGFPADDAHGAEFVAVIGPAEEATPASAATSPPPAAPGGAPRARGGFSRDDATRLLKAALDDDDFRAFTLTELRNIHEEFAYATGRADRTRVLLDRLGPDGVLAALRAHLPDTTARCLEDILCVAEGEGDGSE